MVEMKPVRVEMKSDAQASRAHPTYRQAGQHRKKKKKNFFFLLIFFFENVFFGLYPHLGRSCIYMHVMRTYNTQKAPKIAMFAEFGNYDQIIW